MRILDKIIASALAFLLALMTLDVTWGVFTRYVMGHQAAWTEELARFLLIWIGMLGAAYAAGHRMHLAIDLLPERLSGRPRRRLELLIGALVMLFALAVMVVGGSRYVYLALRLGQISPALQWPMGLVYVVVPLSGLLIVAYQLWPVKEEPRTEERPETASGRID